MGGQARTRPASPAGLFLAFTVAFPGTAPASLLRSRDLRRSFSPPGVLDVPAAFWYGTSLSPCQGGTSGPGVRGYRRGRLGPADTRMPEAYEGPLGIPRGTCRFCGLPGPHPTRLHCIDAQRDRIGFLELCPRTAKRFTLRHRVGIRRGAIREAPPPKPADDDEPDVDAAGLPVALFRRRIGGIRRTEGDGPQRAAAVATIRRVRSLRRFSPYPSPTGCRQAPAPSATV